MAQKRGIGLITSQKQEGSKNATLDVTQYVKRDAQDVSSSGRNGAIHGMRCDISHIARSGARKS